MWIIRLTSSFDNLSSAGTPHGLKDVTTTDNTGEDENSIATFGPTTMLALAIFMCRRWAVPFRSGRGYFVIGAYSIISACFLTT